ncbi:MAG: ATP-grasp domain-containing protein [Pseudonocardia sp.]
MTATEEGSETSTRPVDLPSTPPAYVLGGYEAGLAVIRSLGRAGVPVTCVVAADREHGCRSAHVAAVRIAPDPAEDPDGLADVVAGLAPGVVIPTTDESLEAVAAHRDRLAARHLVACPRREVARVFLDKRLTADAAERADVVAPRTAAAVSPEELEALVPQLQLPCLVKPRESYRYSRAFGVKMHRVDSADALHEAWLRAYELGIGVVVQELIPGPETSGINYNTYVVDGAPVVEFTSRKLRLSPRHFGFPSAVVSGRVPEVVAPGRRIVREMGIEGFANVEFKRDARDGAYKLMEVNGRPNMSGALAVACGVDFPLLTYRHLVEGRVDPATFRPDWDHDVAWINDATDLRAAVARWRSGEATLREGAAPYARRRVFASLALRDPGPFVDRVRARSRRRVQGLRRRVTG